MTKTNGFDESNPYLTPTLLLPPSRGRIYIDLIFALKGEETCYLVS